MLTQLLTALVFTPILGFVGVLLMPKRRERTIFTVAITAIATEIAILGSFIIQWLFSGAVPVHTTIGSIFSNDHYTFSLSFYFDLLSAVFISIAALMTGLIFIFSKYYMHREQGFKRFYYTILLFFIGLSLIIFAGNFEVLLLGWELIGITSVLLIAFYRDRFLPARNALKVFSVYRIADALLLGAIWYAHHVFEKSADFSEFSALAAQHGDQLALLGFLLLGAALIKSAQFPFSYWVPRAMEGPTASSAIFYGALSVHMGVFLLLRTYPLWENDILLRSIIGVIGLTTAIVASSITRVQSSVKTQIAYASITQIGIMFIEVAAGLHWLALLHFISNASLRTYQLLISPSVVGYLVHDQFFYFTPPPQRIKNSLLGKIRATVYVLGIKEWNMNSTMTNYIWKPLKAAGRTVAFLDARSAQVVSLLLLVGMAGASFAPSLSTLLLSTVAAIIGIVFYIRAHATKNSAKTCWNLTMLGNLFGAFFMGLATGAGREYFMMYGVGMTLAYLVGYGCLHYLEAQGESISLREYHGSIYRFKKLGHIFFIVCLFFIAFPVGPSFLAQDMALSLIPSEHAYQVVLFCSMYLLAGISVIRLYTKVFFGPHKTSYHEAAYRSS